jgi:hypothetical protein
MVATALGLIIKKFPLLFLYFKAGRHFAAALIDLSAVCGSAETLALPQAPSFANLLLKDETRLPCCVALAYRVQLEPACCRI